jgi:hypothetical protein
MKMPFSFQVFAAVAEINFPAKPPEENNLNTD